MSMTHFQLARLLEEIAPKVRGALVRKIFQPEKHCLQLGLFTGSGGFFLTVRIAPGLTCLYLASERLGSELETAGDFCLHLRRVLEGRRLESLAQDKDERIVRLAFSGSGENGPYVLVLELFSRSANCFLLDASGAVDSLLHQSAARGRSLRPGLPYAVPALPGKPIPPDKPDPVADLMARRGLADYNSAVEAYFSALAESQALETARKRMGKDLKNRRQRLQKSIAIQQETLAQAARADWFRECGEILAANFRSLKRGLERIRLPDLFAPDRLTVRDIPLDPALSPQENLERYFKKHKKLKTGGELAAPRLVLLSRALESVDSLLARLEKAGSLSEIGRLDEQVSGQAARTKEERKKDGARPSLCYRQFVAEDHTPILVGKGGEENDRLTFHVARGRDLWLHVSGSSGAHVVVPCPQGTYSGQALLDAAHLAVFYSSRRGDSTADVDYTQRKNISRPRGAPPGRVVMSERKTIHLRVDPAILNRLLGKNPAGVRLD